MANSVDSEKMPGSVVSDLDLHFLLRPVFLSILVTAGNFVVSMVTGSPF